MWKHYQDDLYRVTLEILLAMRAFQPTTPSKAEEQHIRAHQKTMRSIFHDSKLDAAQLREAMTFVHCFLTGLSIEHIFERRVRHVDRHLQHINSTLLRSEEHTSELQSLMRTSYAVFCLIKKQHREK